jgi:hypothetical protein
MKKYMKHKRYSTPTQIEPDIAGLINKMQEQLVSLDRKMDALIGKSFPKPFQQPARVHGHGEGRQDNNYRERILRGTF